MKLDKELLQGTRKLLDAQHWENFKLVQLGPISEVIPPSGAAQPSDGRSRHWVEKWRVGCGDGRYDTEKRNAAFSKSTGVGLNFQIIGLDDAIERFEICLIWSCGWRLMYHRDPGQSSWPLHPEFHIQFEPPRPTGGQPPFAEWRLPFTEAEPLKILECLVARVR